MIHGPYSGHAQPVSRQDTVPVARNRTRAVDTFALPPLAVAMIALAIGIVAMPLPGHAGNFAPPTGCRLEYTVQNRGCSVGQHYRCEADPQGDQRSAYFGRQGLTHLSRIDSETRWIESSDPRTGIEDRLVDEAENHASLSNLLATGRDDFDFWTESNTGERLRHVGHDELTGKAVTIDGVDLEETRFRLTTYSATGEVLIEREGQQFVNRTYRRFFGGIETQRDWTGQNLQTNDSPVTFSFPGEAGFGSTTPQFDCDMLMTQLYRERAQL